MLRGFFLRKISNSSCYFAALLISLLDRVCKMFFALEQEDRNSVSAFLATNDFRMSENFSKSYFNKLNDQWDKWTFLSWCFVRFCLYQELKELENFEYMQFSSLEFIFFPVLINYFPFIHHYIYSFVWKICKIFRLKSFVRL